MWSIGALPGHYHIRIPAELASPLQWWQDLKHKTRSRNAAVEKFRWEDRAKFSRDGNDPFYRYLKWRVDHYFETTGKSRYGGWPLALKGIGLAALALMFYGLTLSGAFPKWVLLLFAAGFGIAVLLLAINIGHDAAHNAVMRSHRINGVLQALSFTVLGADAYLWRLRHVKSHHVFPNVNGCDIDIDENPFLRLSPNQPVRWYFRYQHIYAPFIYWLVDLHTVFYQDFVYLFKRRLANMVDIKHRPADYAVFVICKLAHIGTIYVLPVLYLDFPWWQTLLGAFLTTFVMSVVFVTLLIGTHFAEETAFPIVAQDGRIGHSWAYHAMITSVDWSPTSRIAGFLVGGANAHAAHHLFPTISHVHYVHISRMIADAAEKFGVPYNRTTLLQMIRSHFRFLKRMGQGPGATSPRRLIVSPGEQEVVGAAHHCC